MAYNSLQPLQIGIIGHPALLHQNLLHFRQLQEYHQVSKQSQMTVIPVYNEMQIARLDGLLITGWQLQHLYHKVAPMQKSILHRIDSLSLWGVAAGAALLGKNGLLPVIDCSIACLPGYANDTSILEIPGCVPERFVGYFIPQIQFSFPAPNLCILCQNQTHGITAIRQGNHLACGFAAELTPQLSLYRYWAEMVIALKEWKI